ncbi:MAG: Alpha-D-kanosaminyltransferase [Planctomycetota bacterium]|jgi:glycosyltransferase involved in cell wall biosynthesis
MTALRVLHVAATSVPHVNGYTMRLQSILREQARRGLDVAAITSPFYPGRLDPPGDASFDGIDHRRCRHPNETNGGNLLDGVVRTLRRTARASWCPGPLAAVALLAEERLLLARFQRHIEAAARAHRADILHAHTPYRCGLPTIAAGAKLGIPVVYEVRGLWEDTAVVEGQIALDGPAYRHVRRAEGLAVRRADAVIAIGEALAADYVARGARAERTFVAPNGADLERLAAASAAATQATSALRAKLAGRLVVGYVGSLRPLEGVEALVDALAALAARGRDVHGLIVGDGESRAALMARAAAHGLADRCTFPGRVPAGDVGAYYDLIDVFAVTRASSRVTDLVTPIKPLEAMGRGKPVVMSALPALRELGEAVGAAGYYRPGDVEDLAARLDELLGDAERRTSLGERARAWVTRERTWAVTVDRIEAAYRLVGASRAGRA